MTNGPHRKTLYVQLQCLEPLHLGARHPYGLFRSGEKIVRGGRVLVALAQLNGGQLLFGGENNIIVEDAPVMTPYMAEVVHLPLTAETCKAFPGDFFEPDYAEQQGKDPRHGVWDTLLLRWFVAKRFIPDSPTPRWGRCPQCGGSTKPYSCFVERRQDGAGDRPRYRYEEGEAAIERRAHTALNPTRGTAEHGLLFADELIASNTRFFLRIRMQARDQAELNERVQKVTNLIQQRFRLGGAKSRGHGLVQGFVINAMSTPEPLADRLQRFDEYARSELARYNPNGRLESNRTYFTITLQSPLILPDQDVHPHWRICEGEDGDWRQIFPTIAALCEVRLEFVQHRFTKTTGWSSLWQLSKPTLRALAAGSVYVFSTTDQVNDIVPTAEELEFSGSGLCRAEGFGAINVSDPFHREVINYGNTI